jgi:O-antigen/teichoic acid export membrane protein
MPLASGFDAEGQQNRLRGLLIHGTRAAYFILLPIGLALLFRGQTFISLWMGEQYAHTSGRVLQILLLYQFVSTGNYAGSNIALGTENQRPLAWWAGGEAAANLSLSILLVRHIGLYGVAWGTVVPSLFINLVLFPPYVCRIVGVSLRHFLWQAWARPLLAALPFGFACYMTNRYWTPANLTEFFLQIAVILPIFVTGVVITFSREILVGWRSKQLFTGVAQEGS